MKSTLLIFLVLLSGQLFAQERSSSNATVRTEQLHQLVDLNEAQTTQVKTIYADSEQKENAVKANSELSEAEKKAELEKIKREEEASLNKILNETQRSKRSEESGNEPQKANINTSRSNIKQEN